MCYAALFRSNGWLGVSDACSQVPIDADARDCGAVFLRGIFCRLAEFLYRYRREARSRTHLVSLWIVVAAAAPLVCVHRRHVNTCLRTTGCRARSRMGCMGRSCRDSSRLHAYPVQWSYSVCGYCSLSWQHRDGLRVFNSCHNFPSDDASLSPRTIGSSDRD